MKLQINEFEPRWVLTAKFHPNWSTGSGWTGEDTGQNDRQTNRQTETDRQTDKPVSDLVHAPPLSNFRAPSVRRCGGLLYSVTIRCLYL